VDFGEILKKWESGASGRASGAASGGKKSGSQNAVMEKWLQENEITDKDANIQEKRAAGENRSRLLGAKPDAVIDIHGLSSEEAWAALDQFFDNAKENGYEKIRIIHGKGNHSPGDAVLKKTARKFIEQNVFAGESGFEKAVNGGSGATWVLLKN